MSRLLPHVRAARRSAHRQDGVTLLVVMMITMVFGLIVVALLSATMTSIKVGSSTAEQAAEQRAADAAIETWIGQFKTDPTTTGTCGDVTIPGTTPMVVTVTCESDTPIAASGPFGQTSMLLLGGYTYFLHDFANERGFLSEFFGTLADWFAENAPGFLHYGPEPLIIDTGDVVVRQQGLVWHEKTVGSTPSSLGGPAVKLLDGKYVQKPVGLFGNSTLPLFGTSPKCGVLDPAFTDWASWLSADQKHDFESLRIDASKGLRCGQEPSSTTIFDDPNWGPPATFTPAAIRAGMGLTGSCEGRKLSGTNVAALDPGAYNRFDTAVLNGWLTGDCPNTTFWFRPGDYYFDAVGLVRSDQFSRSAIVFDDATSNVVFGSPVGWTPGTSDRAPMGSRTCAINGAAPGVTITLSRRTTILHKAGFVSACSDFAQVEGEEEKVQRPLLYQSPPSASEAWIGKPTVGAAGVVTSTRFTDPIFATGGAADPDTSEVPTAKSATCATCGNPSITLGGFSDVGAPAPYGGIQTATLQLRGSATGTLGRSVDRTRVNVTSADGTKRCTALSMGIGERVHLSGPRILLEGTMESNCGERFTDAIDYEGATVQVTYLPSRQCLLWWCNPYSLTLDYAWVDVSTDNAQPGGTFETRVDPTNGKQLTLFGPVYLPRTQVMVRWMGSDPAAQLDPIFTGGLIAQALLSGVDYSMTPNGKPGKLVGLNRIDGWSTTMLAYVGGRLRTTATVKVDNAPDRPVTITSWRVCNAPASAEVCPLPN